MATNGCGADNISLTNIDFGDNFFDDPSREEVQSVVPAVKTVNIDTIAAAAAAEPVKAGRAVDKSSLVSSDSLMNIDFDDELDEIFSTQPLDLKPLCVNKGEDVLKRPLCGPQTTTGRTRTTDGNVGCHEVIDLTLSPSPQKNLLSEDPLGGDIEMLFDDDISLLHCETDDKDKNNGAKSMKTPPPIPTSHKTPPLAPRRTSLGVEVRI